MSNDDSTAVGSAASPRGPAAAPRESGGGVGHADRHWLMQSIGLTAVVVALAIVFTLVNPRFATVANLANVLTQASYYIIIAAAMTFVITSAGIDLSIGSLLALVTVIGFGFVKGGMNPALAVLLMFAIGAGIGAFTGALITLVKIPPFIATLGMMVALRGFALVHSAGTMHFGLPPSLVWLGQGDILGVPVPIIVALSVAVFAAWLFNHTRFGLHVRAIGGNREAARLAGVRVTLVETGVYALMGLATALGGLIMIARIDSTQATIGTSMEIHVIAAVIIGGTSLFGGRGTIYGTVLGAILLSMMTNALVIAGVDVFWQLVVMGAIVLLAVAISNLRESRVTAIPFLARRSRPV